MEEQEVDTISDGEESVDSIPRPEYEAIEKTTISRQSSPVACNPLSGKEMSTSCIESNSDMQSMEDALSEKTAMSVQDYDLDITNEKQPQSSAHLVENQYDDNKYMEASNKIAEQTSQSTGKGKKEIGLTPSSEAVLKRNLDVPVSISNKLVQAKTKDNKYLLVQLVDENGKPLRPPVRHISKSADITLVAASRPASFNSCQDGAVITAQQIRSSTPISREFLALQKSVNESKILTEFVTDIAVEKARKRKTATPVKDSGAKSEKFITLDAAGTIKVRRRSNTSDKLNTSSESVTSEGMSPEMRNKIKFENLAESKSCKGRPTSEDQRAAVNCQIVSLPKNNAEKPRKYVSSKFIPLKDDSSSYQSNASSNNNVKRRSRSKSVSRKSPIVADSDSVPGKLKRWPSEEKALKRTNMRSQNSEFVQKQMDFLHRVTQQEDENNDDEENEDDDGILSTEEQQTNTNNTTADGDDADSQLAVGFENSANESNNFLGNFMGNTSDQSTSQVVGANDSSTKTLENYLESIYVASSKRGWDCFCWKCRQCADLLACSKCVRSFHATCIKITAATKLDKTWSCPECVAVEHMVNSPKRTRRSELSLDLLAQLLSFALKRMRNVKGLPQFLQSLKNLANFSKYFVNLVTFETLEEKIEKKVFRCAEEFVNETKWILHNALIAAAGNNNKDTITAKAILKICRQEANEIDTCPECYLNANTRSDWFVDVCSQPHLLLWAKLKGFPYWPAKAMGLGQGSHVNVRFFGQHDRAFVPIKDCYLFSEQVPNALTGKRSSRAGFAECIQEVEVHIEKIKSKVGAFAYAPYKTLYDPNLEMQQLEQLMPGVQEFMKRQQSAVAQKPPLQYKIVKTADNHLSIVKKSTNTVDSGTESDHSFGIAIGTAVASTSSSPTSKKKSPDLTDTATEYNKVSKLATTSNYEVIHKIDNDEGNIPKVSAVILKRKAEHAEHRKAVDGGADNELPLPKMTKIEENSEEEVHPPDIAEQNKDNGSPITSSTENISTNATGTVIQKHAIMEPKVPILTIKTNVNKVVETKKLNEVEMRAEAEKEQQKGKESTIVQNTVENLVKNKQGVTIKKLTKEDVRKKQQVVDENNKGKEAVVKTTSTKQSSVTENTENLKPMATANVESDQIISNKATTPPQPPLPTPPPAPPLPVAIQKHQPPLIKNLVPFVEIKKEISSSDDEETAVENVKEMTIIAPGAIQIRSETESIVVPSIIKPKSIIGIVTETNNTSVQPPMVEVLPNVVAPLIETVKKEVLTDDEGVIALPSATIDVAPQTQTSPERTGDTGGNVICAPVPTQTESVRVVGDTTIQRLSTKPTSSGTNLNQTQMTGMQYQGLANNVVVSLPLTGSIYTGLPSQTTTTSIANASKRNSLRGIPYGPLPASATTTSRTVNNYESEKQQQPHHKVRQDVQRARKSFPNRSPNEVSPVRADDATPPITPTVSVNITDPKRILGKTSMVSIPIDVTSRCNNTVVIPVPPLTAVSKVMPITTIPTSVPSTVVSSSAASSSVAAFLNCNGSTQITMSAPPPLAGLSYSTVTTTPSIVTLTSTSSAQLHNGISVDSSAGNTQASNADSHAMNDFVTPSFASAITDAICRGPPRMTPRPNGPLQSDGSTIFPSQAGPVCRTLAENAHKLTDFFISVMENTMCDMSVTEEPVLQAKITMLAMELERTKQNYECEIAELKRTSDLLLSEMRKSMETEKARIAAEVRKQCELERKRSVEETKKKQWCANCGRESQFHCCWNTSYCDYPCQQLHWSRHAASCAQTRSCNNETNNLQNLGVNTSASVERNIVQCSKPSFTAIGSNMPAHYSSKSGINNKKDKTITKVNTNTVSNTMSTPLPSPEVLKLPNNTYLRPVTSSSTVRTPYPTQVPVQRFNIPLPLAAPANPGLPYTLVQREGNWELMSTLTPTVSTSNVSNSMNTSQHQQNRMATTSALMSSKTAPRSRVNTSTVSIQSHGSNMSGSLHGGGALRSTQM